MDRSMTTAAAVWPRPVEAEPPPLPAREGAIVIIDELLRARHRLLARLEDPAQHAEIARAALIATLCAGAAVGAALGIYRGGWQILYAAVKLPLVLLLTAGIATPTLTALQHVTTGRAEPRRDIALVLSALALTSLVISATAPLLVLAALMELDYHPTILLTVGCCGTGGLFGLAFLAKGFSARPDANRFVLVVALATCAIVGAQLSWVLRPFLARPSAEISFVRAFEGGFVDSVVTTTRSTLEER